MLGGVKGNQLSNNSTTAGDIAGGSIDKSIQLNIVTKPDKISSLRKVIGQLKNDCLEDHGFYRCIEQLNHYCNPVNPDDQRDLKTKLNNAGRSDEVYEAEELKEYFTKILVKNNLSENAQNAYVHILSTIKIRYEGKVKPLIKTNASLLDVENNVLSILEEIYSELEGTQFELDLRLVKGMLYFLTGNCHIDWKY